MNFFDRQRAARGTTVRLVLLFSAAVLAIVILVDVVVLIFVRSQPAPSIIGLLAVVSALTLLIIAGGTISKTLSLRAGGSAVALSVGAVPIDPTSTDPQLRRFVTSSRRCRWPRACRCRDCSFSSANLASMRLRRATPPPTPRSR